MADNKTASLLRLCGFEDDELRRLIPRAEKVFNRFGLTQDDIVNGERRMRQYYDIEELQGMRDTIGISIKEFIDICLAKEDDKKVILYGSMPTASTDILCAASYFSKDIAASFPGEVFLLVMGCIFDKVAPVLEAAERQFLRAGTAHCSLTQVLLGLFTLDLIPKPDLLISMAGTCDARAKADESIAEYFKIPLAYLNIIQDVGTEWSEVLRQNLYFAEEIRRCKRKVEEVISFELTDDMLKRARSMRKDAALSLVKLSQLASESDPVPVSANILQFCRVLRGGPLSTENLPFLSKAYQKLCGEIEQRAKEGRGVSGKGAPRIFYDQLVSLADPAPVHLIEQSGLGIAITEDIIFVPDGGFTPRREGIEGQDYWAITAYGILQRTLQAGSPMRRKAIVECLRRNKVDAMLMMPHYSCRWFAGENFIIKDAVEKEVGIPVMMLEYDFYDSRYYNIEQLRTRIEAFAELVKARKLSSQN